MTKIEQVARAVAVIDYEEFYSNSTLDVIKYSDLNWKKYVRRARAAIEAMKGPTESMVCEGINVQFGTPCGCVVICECKALNFETLYNKMIDAALAEGDVSA